VYVCTCACVCVCVCARVGFRGQTLCETRRATTLTNASFSHLPVFIWVAIFHVFHVSFPPHALPSLPATLPPAKRTCLPFCVDAGVGLERGHGVHVCLPSDKSYQCAVIAAGPSSLSLVCVWCVCVFDGCTCVCVYTPHTHTHTRARAHTHTHTRVRLLPLSVYTCMRTCIQRMSVHTCMCTCIHRIYMHAYNAGEHSGNCVCWRCSHHLYLPQPYGTLFSFSLCRPPHPPPTPLLSIISPSPLTFSHTHTYSDTLSVTSPLSLVCPRLHYRLLTLCPAAY
jgi:hypothetical protein